MILNKICILFFISKAFLQLRDLRCYVIKSVKKQAAVEKHVAQSLGTGRDDDGFNTQPFTCRSMIGLDARPKPRISKYVKSCTSTYCSYVRCATLIVRVGGMPWPKTGAFHYHTQLKLPDKRRAMKGLFVCYIV